MSDSLIKPLIKRSRVTMLVTAGVVALSLVSPVGAQAAPAAQKCTIKSFAPARFVVSAKETAKVFAVKTTGCTQQSWRVDLLVEGSAVVLATKAKSQTHFLPDKLDNSLAGRYQVLVTVKSTDGRVTRKRFGFSLLRRTTFGTSFNVGPEPAAAGALLTVVGNLRRVSWGAGPTYVGYANQAVRLQFKAAGTKTYTNIKSVTTGPTGKVSTTVRAGRSGTWRLHYPGSRGTGRSTSAADRVTLG